MRKIMVLMLALVSFSAFALNTVGPSVSNNNVTQSYYEGMKGVVDNSVTIPACKTKACQNAYTQGIQDEIDIQAQQRLD